MRSRTAPKQPLTSRNALASRQPARKGLDPNKEVPDILLRVRRTHSGTGHWNWNGGDSEH